MKWLSTTPILFSVGIICAIAETAVANPWDSFVSDQQIFEAQTIRCDFTTGVSANWDGAEPKLELLRDGFYLNQGDSIDSNASTEDLWIICSLLSYLEAGCLTN